MLGLVFGHTVFAVSTVLTAFMAGLGLGSWVFGRIADRQARPLRLYRLLEIGVGVFCLLVPVLLARAPMLAPAHADLGLAHLGSGNPLAARAALDRALAVDPAHAGAAHLHGEINSKLYGGTTP